jgi:hypothetical protein
MTEDSRDPAPLPVRFSDGNRTATWNPALTRATAVALLVRSGDQLVRRRAMNSGRARVREPETIEAVYPLSS